MAGLGDHEPAVGVLDVAQEVLAPAGVVEADDRRARQRRAAEREEVLGDVVEEHRDMRRPTGRQPIEEEVRPPAGLRDVLAVGPDPVLEPDRRAVAIAGSAALRRSSAAAFGAGSGAWPGAGTAARGGREPDIGVTLRGAVDGAGVAEGGDLGVVVAEDVAQHRVGVLADLGRLARHERLLPRP